MSVFTRLMIVARHSMQAVVATPGQNFADFRRLSSRIHKALLGIIKAFAFRFDNSCFLREAPCEAFNGTENTIRQHH